MGLLFAFLRPRSHHILHEHRLRDAIPEEALALVEDLHVLVDGVAVEDVQGSINRLPPGRKVELGMRIDPRRGPATAHLKAIFSDTVAASVPLPAAILAAKSVVALNSTQQYKDFGAINEKQEQAFEGESDNEDPNDDLEEIHAALKSGAWGKIKPKVVLEGWPKNPSIR